ncbi:MAG: hypothetical protein KJS64_04465 [Acidobacteria bacterium]|nr:hypothetical protein [Acidobacteriota bacterium]
MSEVDRLSEAALRLVGSLTRYAEEAIVRTGGRDRQEIESTLRNAKAIGELTVLMSSAKIKEYVGSLASSPVIDDSENGSVEPASGVGTAPDFIPHYDSLTASQIVSVLPSLSAEERQAVAIYESGNRARSLILQHLRP